MTRWWEVAAAVGWVEGFDGSGRRPRVSGDSVITSLSDLVSLRGSNWWILVDTRAARGHHITRLRLRIERCSAQPGVDVQHGGCSNRGTFGSIDEERPDVLPLRNHLVYTLDIFPIKPEFTTLGCRGSGSSRLPVWSMPFDRFHVGLKRRVGWTQPGATHTHGVRLGQVVRTACEARANALARRKHIQVHFMDLTWKWMAWPRVRKIMKSEYQTGGELHFHVCRESRNHSFIACATVPNRWQLV